MATGLLLMAGCGGNENPGRRPLYGTVRVDGDLVTTGTITLLPAENHSGVAASTSIVDGRYQFTEESGPVAGPHRVIVGAVDARESTDGEEDIAAAGEQSIPDAAIKATPAGSRNRPPAGSARAPAERSAIPSKLEMQFDVPPEGDLKADLKFGTK